MAKAFLFDYVGAITAAGTFGDDSAGRILSSKLNISLDEANKLLVPFWADYSAGRISKLDMWDVIGKRYGKTIPIEARDI